MMKCFITGEELPEDKLVKIHGDYPVYRSEKGRKVTEYKYCNVFVSRVLYHNNNMDIIMEVVRRKMSDNEKLKNTYPKGFNLNKKRSKKQGGILE